MLTTTAFKERQNLVAPLAERLRQCRSTGRLSIRGKTRASFDWMKKTERKKLVIAGQWTEVCRSLLPRRGPLHG
jgi:hypothetical protein